MARGKCLSEEPGKSKEERLKCLCRVYNLRIAGMKGKVKVSLKVEYACRVLAQLARSYGSGELPHIEDLATAEEVPANYLVQILNELRNGGLIVSRRGKQGGYALARAPEEVSLYDIVKAIDGEVLALSEAGHGQSGERVLQVWSKIAARLEKETKAVTLSDLSSGEEAPMYFI